MLKKILVVSMLVTQCMLSASLKSQDQKNGDSDKSLSKSQPIVIKIQNTDKDRLSKSDPGYRRPYDNSPNAYLNYGDLGKSSSPSDDQSLR